MGMLMGSGDLILRTDEIKKLKGSAGAIIEFILLSVLLFCSFVYIFSAIFTLVKVLLGRTDMLLHLITLLIMSPVFIFGSIFLLWFLQVMIRTGDIEIGKDGMRLSYPQKWIPKERILDIVDSSTGLDRYRREFADEYGNVMKAMRTGRLKMDLLETARRLDVGKCILIVYKDPSSKIRMNLISSQEFNDIPRIRRSLFLMKGIHPIKRSIDMKRSTREYRFTPDIDRTTRKEVVVRMIVISLMLVLISAGTIGSSFLFGHMLSEIGLFLLLLAFFPILIFLASNSLHFIGRYRDYYEITELYVKLRPLKHLDLIIEFDNVLSIQRIPVELNRKVMPFRMGRKFNGFFYPTRFYKNLFHVKLMEPARSVMNGVEGKNPYIYHSFILGDDGNGTLYRTFVERASGAIIRK